MGVFERLIHRHLSHLSGAVVSLEAEKWRKVLIPKEELTCAKAQWQQRVWL